MGETRIFSKEMLIMGVLSSRPEEEEQLRHQLMESFGKLAAESEVHPFYWTRYYQKEMGPAIRRYFLAFDQLRDPADLAAVKIRTNGMEDAFREKGQRKINLDPGFLSLNRLILATTKDTAHRVPLRDGIYAELTLLYQCGRYKALEWTYPDYASEEFAPFFLQLRDVLRRKLKQ